MPNKAALNAAQLNTAQLNTTELNSAGTSRSDSPASNFNHTRRHLLKSIGAVTISCSATPLLASTPPMLGADAPPSSNSPMTASSNQVEFRFVDSKSIAGMTALGQGTIINRSASDIVVVDIAPHLLVTSNGRYHVSSYLAENPIRLASGQQHHFWVRPIEHNPASRERPTPHKMHGSLSLKNSHRTHVAARIDSPSIGVDPDVQPFELTITTGLA